MAQLVVLYKTPSDRAAFDAYYSSTHIPLAKKLPGLKKYEVSTGLVKAVQGESPYHLVAILHFASTEAVFEALGSPEGKATARDLANFAQAGVELYAFETKDV